MNLTINNINAFKESIQFNNLINVYTAMDNFQRTTFARATWDQHSVFSKEIMKLVHLVGLTNNGTIQKSIHKEAKIHKDIIQGDFLDNDLNKIHFTLNFILLHM